MAQGKHCLIIILYMGNSFSMVDWKITGVAGYGTLYAMHCMVKTGVVED
jgi:hypothetical protein